MIYGQHLQPIKILTQNYHNDYLHNMRLALDPWSGIVHPIIIDPFTSVVSDNIINKQKIPLDHASHSLFLLLNKSSLFVDSKYNKLFYFANKTRVINNEIKSLNKIKENIEISLTRDIEKKY